MLYKVVHYDFFKLFRFVSSFIFKIKSALLIVLISQLIDAKMLIGEDLVRKALIHFIRTAGIEYYPDKSYARLHVDPFNYETKTIAIHPESTVDFIRSASKVVEGVKELTRSDYLPVKKNPFTFFRSKVVRLKRNAPAWNYARDAHGPLNFEIIKASDID